MWQVLYVPCAMQLTHGGFFPQHAEGEWDTPESAKLVLHGLMTHHKGWLERLRMPDGATLADMAQRGLDDTQGGEIATQKALEVKDALYHQDQVRKPCMGGSCMEAGSLNVPRWPDKPHLEEKRCTLCHDLPVHATE